MTFFRAMGWDFDLDFTDDQGACLIISESIFVMLLVEEYFMSFTHRPLPAKDSSEVILSLSAPSKQDVDRLLAAALDAGASETSFSDLGWMYQR
ncbi:MAG: VOC family protein, partial [Erysipelotrichaceae bacterium]